MYGADRVSVSFSEKIGNFTFSLHNILIWPKLKSSNEAISFIRSEILWPESKKQTFLIWMTKKRLGNRSKPKAKFSGWVALEAFIKAHYSGPELTKKLTFHVRKPKLKANFYSPKWSWSKTYPKASFFGPQSFHTNISLILLNHISAKIPENAPISLLFWSKIFP
jgi:hypothetical protein